MPDEKLIEGPIPILLNLGNWFSNSEDTIGHARVYQLSDGRKRIDILLNDQASKELTDLTEIFKLKGIGFAGVKRGPTDGR